MKASQAMVAMAAAYKNNSPRLMLLGSPGCGKTSMVHQLPAFMGKPKLPVWTLQATLYAPDEIKGLPTLYDDPKTGRQVAKFLPFEDMPSAGEGILIIDDLPHAPNATQNALMRLFLEGVCGSWDVGGIRIFATGNRSKDKAGARDMQTAMGNRVTQIPIEISYDDWRPWAVTHDVRPEIIAYLGTSYGSKYLSDDAFDPNRGINPTPRSWEFASQWYDALGGEKGGKGEILTECLNGCVGQEATAHFMGWLKFWYKLPDLQEIIAGKAIYPDNLDVFYPTICGLVQIAKSFDGKKQKVFQALIDWSVKIPDKFCEMGVLLSKDLIALDKNCFTTCNIDAWHKKYVEVVV